MDLELRNTTGLDGEKKAKTDFGGHRVDSPARSSLRLQYEAQTQVIRKQTGDLESIRLKLGLSARKICQLLLVDPSAWTRWTKPGGDAPPHIYRALQWYLVIQEKIPGLTADYFIGRNLAVENAGLQRDFDRKYEALEKGQLQWSETQKRELQAIATALDASVLRELELRTKVGRLESQTRAMLFVIAGLLLTTGAFLGFILIR